ncbi:dicarboxylate/amino acid:cation symporter [Rheinheimera soli]|uniref:Na+/H+-dicarboxylate symporter n=1 Tax=Rheinheimera soli TaxID=443616 RepID=A0ABU1VWR3_9GAMM|nr:dicarboxylate/amino acid:cation symporter [Rheinheimera soli]MDR7120132.1 Na+/H+-dicarboxylate symporter [Rheinheimera soli]
MKNISLNLVLWQQVLLALVLGVIAGLVLGGEALVLKPLGTAYINAIRMLVIPLVFFSLTLSITSLGKGKGLGRIASKTVGLFLLTALIASLIGLGVGTAFQFETGQNLVAAQVTEKVIPPVSQVLVDLIPANPVAAMAQGQVLPVMLFAILLGLALRNIGEKGAAMLAVVRSGADMMFEVTRLVLLFTPVGVFGLMAWVVGTYGLEMLLPLAKFILAIYVGCLLHISLTYGGLVHFFSSMKVTDYFKAIFPVQLVAFSTCSSYASLPASYKAVTEDLKVSKDYAGFVLPLGSTINMDGCGGIYPAIAAIFIASLYGIELQFIDYLLIVGTATLASLGTAGVPGTALVMLTVTLSVVGLPLEGIAFIAAIDRIIDMARTTTNVTGDTMVALVIAEQEGLLTGSVAQDTLEDDSVFAKALADTPVSCEIRS